MISLRIDGRARDLGGFSVARLLPHPGRRSIGPFVFFDHLAPAVVRMRSAGRLVLFGGAPRDGPRHIWWNFVASDPEAIDRAADDWAAASVGGRFGRIPGETEWIPLPDTPLPKGARATV